MYDAVVAGVGGVGSFALRALSRQQGGKYLGLERFHLGHARGSSHGKTRIYRRAYFEDPHYVPWIEYSLSLFRALEKAHGVSLMQECGSLLIEPAALSGDEMPPLLRASWEAAQQHGIPVEFIGQLDLPERFPQFHYPKPNKMVGLLEPHGGFLRPELSQQIAIKEATSSSNSSVSIMENTEILSLEEIPGSSPSSTTINIKIQCNDNVETVSTKKLLVCMGAWTGQVLRSWSPHLKVIRQLQGWIDTSHIDRGHPENNNIFSYHHMPAWVYDNPTWDKPLYGVPCDTHDAESPYWLKAGIHGRDHVVPDPTTNPIEVSEQERTELGQAVAHGLNTELLGASSDGNMIKFADIQPCMYTMTKDIHYMIGVPRGYTNVFAVAGLSGHGFKMTPALGQIMADFCQEKDLSSEWKIDFCSPRRFEE